MGVEVTYRCDICRTVKGDTNHWYLATVLNHCEKEYPYIKIFKFRSEPASMYSILCGEACVHKFISQNLIVLHPPQSENTEREASSPVPLLDMAEERKQRAPKDSSKTEDDLEARRRAQ